MAAAPVASRRREPSPGSGSSRAAGPGPKRTASSACATCRRRGRHPNRRRPNRTPNFLQTADDAARDHPAIGDENLMEHPHPRSAPRAASGCRRCKDCSIAGSWRSARCTSIAARISTYFPGPLRPSANRRPPSGVTGTFMKKLMLCERSRLVKPQLIMFGQGQQIAVAAGMHGVLFQRIAHRVRFAGAGASQGIVAADSVGHDFRQYLAAGREQLRAETEVHIALLADRVHARCSDRRHRRH